MSGGGDLAPLEVGERDGAPAIGGADHVPNSKQEMIAAARARGLNPTDNNEADALDILHWAIDTREGLR